MSNKILIKRGSGAPTTSNLDNYEIAYDTGANKLYIRDGSDIIPFGAIVDEDNFASDDANRAPSQQSTKAYIASELLAAGAGDITAVVAGNGLTGGATSGSATLNIGAGTGIDVAADAISVDVSDFMSNGANNRVLTATGTDGINAESSLLFSGTQLTNTGDIKIASGSLGVSTNAPSGDGRIRATSYITAGYGTGGVALTHNDGYGNANVTFNHEAGVPEQNGQSARIEVNTDATLNEGLMYFEVSSADVTSGSAVSLANALTLAHDYIEMPKMLRHMGDTDTYIQYDANRIYLVAGGTTKYDSNNGNVIATGDILDQDDMSSNSATAVASQQSIKAYVDAEVAGVVNSAPAALNTLDELAAALGDDANFATTTSTALGNRLRVDTAAQGLTGTQQANAITNLGITATKAELNYVDGVTSNIQTQLNGKQASGSYLTSSSNLNASNLSSGTVNNARLNTDMQLTSAAPRYRLQESDVTNTPNWWMIADGGNMSFRLNNTGTYPLVFQTNGTNDAVTGINLGYATAINGTLEVNNRITATGTDGFTIGNYAGYDRIVNNSNVFRFLTDGDAYANMQFATVTAGTWNGSVIASAYLDADTAHLSGSQTFSGAKTFSSHAEFDSTINVDSVLYGNQIDLTGELNFTGAGNKIIDIETLAGSNSLTIRHHNPTGNLFENALKLTANGSTELYYNNSKKFETTNTGATVTGTFGSTGAITANNGKPVMTENGSWFGDLGSNGWTRVFTLDNGSGVMSWALKNGQMSTIIDGSHFAYEAGTNQGGGFYSSSDSTYANATGIVASGGTLYVKQADGSNASLYSTGDLLCGSGFISGVGAADLQLRRTTNNDDRIVIEASETKIFGDAVERVRFGSYGIRNGYSGSVGTPSYSFIDDTDTGMYRLGVDDLGFSAGGVLRYGILNGLNRFYANVVVGPNNNNSKPYIQYKDGYDTASTPSYSWYYDNGCGIGHPAGSTIAFSTGSAERARITNTGLSVDGNITAQSGHYFIAHNESSYQKYDMYAGNGSYCIGMYSGNYFGGLNDWAMTFTFYDTQGDRGFLWRSTAHSTSQGAMSLTTGGKLSVAHSTRIGYGISDTTTSGATYALDVSGSIGATADVVAYVSSDKRLKDNIKNIANPLEKLEKLNGVEFDWNDKQDLYKGHDIGVIAQEVEEVLPEIVDTREDGHKAVKYDRMVALLIEAVKEQQQQINELKEKLNG